jgi:hypothetical protein
MKSGLWLLLLTPLTLQAQPADAILDLHLRKGLITSQEFAETKQQFDAALPQTIANHDRTRFAARVEKVTWSGEVAWQLSPQRGGGTPARLTLSGEYLRNVNGDYPRHPEGGSAQVTFGDNKKKRDWLLLDQYRRLQADATWDAITDSDFGIGGTDRHGHVLRATYNLHEGWEPGFQASLTEKISDTTGTGHENPGAHGETLLRVRSDSTFKF